MFKNEWLLSLKNMPPLELFSQTIFEIFDKARQKYVVLWEVGAYSDKILKIDGKSGLKWGKLVYRGGNTFVKTLLIVGML